MLKHTTMASIATTSTSTAPYPLKSPRAALRQRQLNHQLTSTPLGRRLEAIPEAPRSPPRSMPRTNPYLPRSRGNLNSARSLRCPTSPIPYAPALPPRRPTSRTDSSHFQPPEPPRCPPSRADSTSQTQVSNAHSSVSQLVSGVKSLGVKGELYLSMLCNGPMLTVTIEQARNLIPPGQWTTTCNCYIKLSLSPDKHARATQQCKTNMVLNSLCPVFGQTFSIELLPGDERKRLLISVWHRDLNADRSVLLGCMAFTVATLATAAKQTEGWFFVLSPSTGRKKHLAVDKVNMLTYYGSVDSGLSSLSAGGSSGGSEHFRAWIL